VTWCCIQCFHLKGRNKDTDNKRIVDGVHYSTYGTNSVLTTMSARPSWIMALDGDSRATTRMKRSPVLPRMRPGLILSLFFVLCIIESTWLLDLFLQETTITRLFRLWIDCVIGGGASRLFASGATSGMFNQTTALIEGSNSTEVGGDWKMLHMFPAKRSDRVHGKQPGGKQLNATLLKERF
jgi:hypothetical protein